MRKTGLLIAALLLGSPAWAAPPEVTGTIKADAPYGQGRVRFLLITAYSATLWTDAKSWSMDAPFALTITYGLGFDTDDLVSRAISEIKHVNPAFSDADVAKITPQLNKDFPPVKAGDHITAFYVPGRPVSFFRNGSATGTLDNGFARDFFAIWLSPQTSDPSLRNALLKLK